MSTLRGKGNKTAAKKRYHHGDLGSALVDAGLRLLASRDVDELSLRELARDVGVSATAVYRHFPDKQALMMALAGEGLRRLAVAQHEASDAAGGGPAGFNATGRAYVRFALANPALFRLIFSHPSRAGVVKPGGDEEPEAMSLLRANAAALTAPGGNPRAVALHAWSLAHGLAMLMLDGQIPTDDATIDAVVGELGHRAGRQAEGATQLKRPKRS
ncbi:MAG: TetR/AcrR family transcriptional regulator [Rhizobacter sp.]|nr:TetR/AcrR family transcriptional regulator [Rhizobacter sp.]